VEGQAELISPLDDRGGAYDLFSGSVCGELALLL
jgi:hypothetical protein